MKRLHITILLVVGILFSSPVASNELRLAVTTSFHNSGLSEVLKPAIKADLGMTIHLLVVGTGQALKLGRQGDVDAILVHSQKAEEQFISQGFAPHRREIMYNDFVIIGPHADKAGVLTATSAAGALQKIASNKFSFVSRGDDSGTHRKEIALWQSADIKPSQFSSDWYKSAGAGMGAALNLASAMDAYIMSDRASWLKFKNKRGLRLLFAGDPVLFNQYAYLPIDPKRHPHVKWALAAKLETWLASERGQALIGSYQLLGEPLFIPNAR